MLPAGPKPVRLPTHRAPRTATSGGLPTPLGASAVRGALRSGGQAAGVATKRARRGGDALGRARRRHVDHHESEALPRRERRFARHRPPPSPAERGTPHRTRVRREGARKQSRLAGRPFRPRVGSRLLLLLTQRGNSRTQSRDNVLSFRLAKLSQQPLTLNSTRRSSASRTSSVPVPTMFSWKPTPLDFSRPASSPDSFSRRSLM